MKDLEFNLEFYYDNPVEKVGETRSNSVKWLSKN